MHADERPSGIRRKLRSVYIHLAEVPISLAKPEQSLGCIPCCPLRGLSAEHPRIAAHVLPAATGARAGVSSGLPILHVRNL